MAKKKKAPKVLNNTFILPFDDAYYFDCDDTLVMWPPGPVAISWPESHKRAIEFKAPHGRNSFWLKPHLKHIQKLKGRARSGGTVVVWSAGGYKWAEEVVRVLDLWDHVDYIMGKPAICFDDQPVGSGIAPRRYFQPKKDEDDVV